MAAKAPSISPHRRVPALTYEFTSEQFRALADLGIAAVGHHGEFFRGDHTNGGPSMEFTDEEYDRMIGGGVFQEDERVELLDGKIILMSPVGYRHAKTVDNLTQFFIRRARNEFAVSSQNLIQLGGDSRPQPDVVLLKPETRLKKRHPRASEVLLLIEVADSSIDYDRTAKLPEYAKARITEVWIVNLLDDEIEIYRQPSFDGYKEKRVFGRKDKIAPARFPKLAVSVDKMIP